MSKDRTVKECEGCLKSNGTICTVINEPRWIWGKHGKCFARCENVAEMKKIEDAVLKYGSSCKITP